MCDVSYAALDNKYIGIRLPLNIGKVFEFGLYLQWYKYNQLSKAK